MKVLRLPQFDMHWREDGDPTGEPVVFANSLGTDLRLWDSVIDLLPRAGYRFIRFDKRGHGLSSCPASPYTMDELVADVEALLSHLSVKTCTFVGLSIGGMIGQQLASNRPDLVKALVLSNTAAKMGEPAMWAQRMDAVRAGGLSSIADAVLERWFSADFRQTAELSAWKSMLTRTPADGYAGCCAAIAGADLTETTRKLGQPVLCIGGSEDLASPPSLVRGTSDLIAGSQYVEISGAGHLPCVEAPQVFANHLNAFLQETRHV